jgi:hypothetical protein
MTEVPIRPAPPFTGTTRPEHLDPQLYARKPAAQVGPYVPPAPDRVLVNREIRVGDAVRICPPVRMALGITKARPLGQVHPSWRLLISHGYGQRATDGKITESVLVRTQHDVGRLGVALMWTRPVPPAAVMAGVALLFRPGRWGSPGYHWPAIGVAALLRALKAPRWTSELCTWWRLGEHGRPADTPRAEPAKDVRDMIRTGSWA